MCGGGCGADRGDVLVVLGGDGGDAVDGLATGVTSDDEGVK